VYYDPPAPPFCPRVAFYLPPFGDVIAWLCPPRPAASPESGRKLRNLKPDRRENDHRRNPIMTVLPPTLSCSRLARGRPLRRSAPVDRRGAPREAAPRPRRSLAIDRPPPPRGRADLRNARGQGMRDLRMALSVAPGSARAPSTRRKENRQALRLRPSPLSPGKRRRSQNLRLLLKEPAPTGPAPKRHSPGLACFPPKSVGPPKAPLRGQDKRRSAACRPHRPGGVAPKGLLRGLRSPGMQALRVPLQPADYLLLTLPG